MTYVILRICVDEDNKLRLLIHSLIAKCIEEVNGSVL